MHDDEEDRGDEEAGVAASPKEKITGDEGLGSETGGLDGPEGTEASEGGLGGDPAGGPTKDAASPPGGGSVDGPAPGGVPKEGHVEPHEDSDTASGSTD